MKHVMLIQAFLLISGQLKAQIDQSGDSIKTVDMEGIVIKATRADNITSMARMTVSKAEIERIYAGQDASVVLERLTPSIVSYSDAGTAIGNYNQFRLRGIDQTRINVTLNGVPLNDMIDQGVYFSNFSDFSNSAESVQVQRGVGTSTNGVASYAGSVNFESIRLNAKKPSVELQFLGGSFDTYRFSGEIGTGKLKHDMAFYSRFTRTVSGGYKANAGSDSYSFFFSGGYVGEKEVIKVTGFAGKTENDQSYLPVLKTDIDKDPRTNYNHPNDTDDFEQELVQVQYSRVLNTGLTMNSTLYYGGSGGVFPFGLDATTQLLFGLENDHYGLIADLNYEHNALNLAAGVHGYLFGRKNTNGTAPNVSQPEYADETDKNEVSMFARASYKIGHLTLFGDIQLRSVKMKFSGQSLQNLASMSSLSRGWTFFNPKAGVSYALNGRSTIYTSFGRSGREPTRTDILQGDGSGIYSNNLASLLDEQVVRAEYVNDLEVGYHFAGSRLQVSANYFFMDFENEISLVGALAARSYAALRQNTGRSWRSGVEITSAVNLTDWLNFSFMGSYLNSNVSTFINADQEVFNDVSHIFVPRWILNPGIQFTPGKKLKWSLSGRYVSESFMELGNDPDFILPDFFLLDTRIDYAFSDKVSISLMLNNVFNELYFTDGSPVDLDFDGLVEGPGFRVQPPRNYYGMLTIKF